MDIQEREAEQLEDQGSRICTVRIVGGSRGSNFTLILTLSNRHGMIHHEFFQSGTNVDRFGAWLRAAGAADSSKLVY